MNWNSNSAVTTRDLIETAVRLLDGEDVSIDERQQLLLAGGSEFKAFLSYHRISAVLNQYLHGAPETHVGQEAAKVAVDLREFRSVAEQISVALGRERIPYAFLKGIQLLENVYESDPIRPMGDIDLLVSKRDVSRTCSILEELGCGYPTRQIDAWFLRRFHYEITMERGPVDIDVHWGLDHPLTLYPVSTEELLKSTEKFSIGETSASGVSTELMLVCCSLNEPFRMTGASWCLAVPIQLNLLFLIHQSAISTPSDDGSNVLPPALVANPSFGLGLTALISAITGLLHH